jgi:hypothetical protein
MRVYSHGNWFDPISSRSILEADFEQSVFRFAPQVFQGYWCIKFDTLVQSDFGDSKADMVLIDQEYRGWSVVEIELEHHSLTRHVEPQMRRLVNGRYTDTHVEAIHKRCPEVDPKRLSSLVRSVEPEFLVVVPREEGEWRTTLANLGVKLAVVGVFVDHQGRRLVTHDGDHAQRWEGGHLSRLIRDGFLPRAFRLDVPSAIPDSDALVLMYHGFRTTWRVIRAKKATYILPNGSLDLDEHSEYQLMRSVGEVMSISETRRNHV